jgi:hypothetical protein
MIAILKALIPSSLRKRWKNLHDRLDELDFRLKSLERSFDAIIESPKYARADSVGFNGQAGRKRVFEEICRAFVFDVIVETGTYLGNTTAYMAETSGVRVITCEVDKRFYTVSKTRLSDFDNIQFYLGDSRGFLINLVDDGMGNKTTFFYLDAHWYADLPLQEEIDLIAANWNRFCIMIDDFRVPGDEGYGYDSYGPGKSLELDLIQNSIARGSLGTFFPATPSSNENGSRRGCIVLTSQDMTSSITSRCNSLRLYNA